jgi:hypothetical protein
MSKFKYYAVRNFHGPHYTFIYGFNSFRKVDQQKYIHNNPVSMVSARKVFINDRADDFMTNKVISADSIMTDKELIETLFTEGYDWLVGYQ